MHSYLTADFRNYRRGLCWAVAAVFVLGVALCPDSYALSWGKKKTSEAQDVSQVEAEDGIKSSVITERTTIEMPRRESSTDKLEAEAQSDSPLATALPEEDYRVGPGDVLSFQSFDDPSLSRDSQVVLYDGTLSLPLIPDINVNGLTRQEVEDLVRASYGDVFKDPQLTLSVRTAASKYYYVLGDVLHAAKFPYENPISVLAAINIAGGLRTSSRSDTQEFASSPGTLAKAFIIRDNQGQRQVIDLDLSYMTDKGPHPSETLVLPGDFVYVPEGVNLVYVLGEVRSPNVFQLAEGQTLTQTLTRAGGPVESTGKIKQIVLIRGIDATHSEVMVIDWKEIMRTGNDILLKPGNVVYVPRKGLVKLGEFVSRVTGPISQVLGLYTQYFDAYYAEDRNKLLVNSGSTSDAVSILNNVRNFGSLLQDFQNSGSTPPAIP